jgi:hypothetical protein
MHARAALSPAATTAAMAAAGPLWACPRPRAAASLPAAPFHRHCRRGRALALLPMHASSSSSSSAPTPTPTPTRRPQQQLLAEVAASAAVPATMPRRDAGFFARRAAALEALLPGLIEGGALHALTPHEARALLDQGVGEQGSSAAARLVRLSAAVPAGVDVGEMVRRCPRLLMMTGARPGEEEEEEGAEAREAEGEAHRQHQHQHQRGETSERRAVARLRAVVAFAFGGDGASASTEAALAALLREHPELLLPAVAGSRRALSAKLALLERGLAARRARCGIRRGEEENEEQEQEQRDDDNDADANANNDPTRSARALAAACPSLLARDEPALAAVLAEMAEVDAALQEEEGAADAATATVRLAQRLHGRILAARPGLLRHYGRGGRSGFSGGKVLEAVRDGPSRLELPSAAALRALLEQRPEALEALVPLSRC